MTPATAPASTPSIHPLLAVARELAPRVAARSEEIEAARRLPADLARELAQAGLFRMWVPQAYGGHELHPATFLEVVETIARADGSTGWCLMIGAATAIVSAWLPEKAARTIYEPREAITGGVAAPLGRAERVEGGFRVTGRWAWASGSQNCQWLVGNTLVTQGGQPVMSPQGMPEMRFMMFPARDVVIHDTWYTSGLCGTGSCDIEVKELFVPADFSFSLFTDPPQVGRPLYAFPVLGLLGIGLPAVSLGIARRAIDELSALAHQKVLLPSRKPLASRAAIQTAVAEAEAHVRSARAWLFQTVNDTYVGAPRGEVSAHSRADLRLALNHAIRASAHAVDLMYDAAGGTSVLRTSPLQRCFRDVHTASQHAMVTPALLETVGSVLLGLETDTTML
jgi:alkylation response protein AidB-like acyl-CoA dehydrogenase